MRIEEMRQQVQAYDRTQQVLKDVEEMRRKLRTNADSVIERMVKAVDDDGLSAAFQSEFGTRLWLLLDSIEEGMNAEVEKLK